MTTVAEKSLYERLGGYNVIAEIISDLYDRMLSDSHIWYYWKGHSKLLKAGFDKIVVAYENESALRSIRPKVGKQWENRDIPIDLVLTKRYPPSGSEPRDARSTASE